MISPVLLYTGLSFFQYKTRVVQAEAAVSRSVFSAIRVTTEGWVTAANVEWAMTYVPMGNNVSVRDNVLQLGCKVKVLMTLVPYCL